MTLFGWLAIFLLTSVVSALPQPRDDASIGRKCGTEPTEKDILDANARFSAVNLTRIMSTRPSGPDGLALAAAPVQVHWHIILGRDTRTNQLVGDLTAQQISDSMAVLNRAYVPVGISFAAVNVTRTVDTTWFAYVGPSYPGQTAMKTLLRAGDRTTLNIYTVGFLAGASADVLGYSTLPSDYALLPLDDGVVIRYSTVPGGAQLRYNKGMTLVHEVGHWCGLLHPFQGGCYGVGDLVDDTPPTVGPVSGCPLARDTCPGGGADLVHNYMDYATDDCVNSFTPGQIARIKQQMAAFRGIII